jgi:outer membrane protein assembly factor BamD
MTSYLNRQLTLAGLCLLIALGCSSTDEKHEGKTAAEDLYTKASQEMKDENYQRAIELYNELKTKYPYSTHAKDAELGVADAYFKQDSFTEAAASYNSFLQLYPKDDRVPYALFQQGLSYANDTPGVIARDLVKAQDAVDVFTRLIERYPQSNFKGDAEKKRREMREKMAAKEEYIGNFYYIRDFWQSASMRYERIIQEFAGLGFDEIALFRAGMSLKNLEQKEKAKEYLSRLIQKYPGHPLAGDAKEALEKL